jgi:drug/metabolite transporter (DMT)-like permease
MGIAFSANLDAWETSPASARVYFLSHVPRSWPRLTRLGYPLIGVMASIHYPCPQASQHPTVMRTPRLPQHVARNVEHDAAQYGWFLALTLIPLAQLVSIEFTMPIWSAVLAVLFLGERMNGRK